MPYTFPNGTARTSPFCLPVRGFQELPGAVSPSWTLQLCSGQTLYAGTCLFRGASSAGPTGFDLLQNGVVVASDNVWTARPSGRRAIPPTAPAALHPGTQMPHAPPTASI